jgi:hypothetical protein
MGRSFSPAEVDSPPRHKRWRRPWIAPMAVLSLLFLAFSLPPYLRLDPQQSRIPVPAGVTGYYPLLVAHVLFGSVALLTVCLQVWPRFRSRYPAWHRVAGLAYVFCGVLPAGVTGLVIGAFSPFGPVARASNLLLASLWLCFTLVGWRMARRRRRAEHRRWMIRSFALTVSILTNRVWGAVAFLILEPQLETTFRGDETMLAWTIAGLSTWLGWTIPLLIAEAWLERDVRQAQTDRAPAVPPEPAPA